MLFSRLLFILSIFGLSPNGAWADQNLIQAGSSAPDFSLQNSSGKPVRLKDYLGKKILLHFWAPSCFVCPQEVQALNRLQNRFGTDLSQIVTVVSFDSTKKSLKTISEMDVDLPMANDLTNSVADIYGVKTLPETFAIDEQGNFIEISDPDDPLKQAFHFKGPRDWIGFNGVTALKQAGFIP